MHEKKCIVKAKASFLPRDRKEPLILGIIFGEKPDDADAEDSVRMKGDMTIRIGRKGLISIFADRMDRNKPDIRVYGHKKEKK
ncbi:MAG: hypothetical protein IKX02_02770 [Spirochaetales bacterium]|nr:hypothetical protein [Spirochaetales bacterium]